MKFILSLDNKGVLKRGLIGAMLIVMMLSVLMAHYALSGDVESSIYNKVEYGNYIDTGLDKTKGISMDLVEKGLTHKVLEFEIASDIAAQDIQLLIAENNFDANAGDLSKLSIASREEPVYETLCNPYDVEDKVNSSITKVENCTSVQKGMKTVEEEQWLPVEIKLSEKNADVSLATFNILEKGRYRYSFNTPIVNTGSGWGNAGTVFLKVGSDLFADKQHSSWWNMSWAKKRTLNVTNNENFATNDLRVKFIMNTSDYFKPGCNDLVIIDEATNETFDWANETECGNANTIFWFRNTSISALSTKTFSLYYNNSDAVYAPKQLQEVQRAKNIQDSITLWRFDGDLYDDSNLNSNDGYGVTSFETAKFGQGAVLTTSDAMLFVNHTLWDGLTGGTITFWWKYSSATGSGHLINSEYTGVGGDSIKFDIGTSKLFQVKNHTTQSQQQVQHSIQWDGSQFWHVALVWDGSVNNMSIYINGTIYNSSSFAGIVIKGDTNRLNLGKDSNGNNGVAGLIDDFRVLPYDAGQAVIKQDALTANFSIAMSLEYIQNVAPFVSQILILPSVANTNSDINCSFVVTDLNAGDSLTANVSWYNGTVLYTMYTIAVTNGTLASNMLHNLNTTKGETWNCSVIAYDGQLYSDASSAARYINNTLPNVASYNASNATYTYNNTLNVNFSEGENITFAVSISDADIADGNETLWYSWFVDDLFAELTQNSWFNKAWGWLSSGLHNVRVDVNDTSNATTSQTWNVNIANVVNKLWSVDYALPTPVNNTILTSTSVNISVLVSPSVVKAAAAETFSDSSEADFDNGTYENTNYSLSKLALVLNQTGLFEDFFNESFESGLGSWVVTGAGTLWNAQSGSSRTGAYHTEANNTGVGSTTYMYSNISTLGYAGINVTYYRQLVNLGSNDVFAAEWYNGTGWADLERVIIGGNDADYVARSFNLSLAADGNPAFRLRFACQNGQATEKCRLDDVAVSGTTLIYVAKGNFTSRVFTASEEAVWETINWSSDAGAGSSLKFKVKSCASADCSDASFTGDYYTSPGSLIVNNNQYVQYRAFFETTNSSVTPELFNVSIVGHTIEEVEDVTINNAWIEWNGVNKPMSGSGYLWSYANNTLDKGLYTYKVYVNDSFGNINMTEERTFIVPSYNITFNVTSGEFGYGLNGTTITCVYSGFYQNDDPTPNNNPYGSYTFPVDSWSCIFSAENYFTKTENFIADATKIVPVKLSMSGKLTTEEHNWLESLYKCMIDGDCTAFKFWQSTNQTVSKIWQQYLPTDKSVVVQEDRISSLLSATSNITINYTLNIPFKEGYEIGELLPIRIFYWFTDDTGKCYSQDKQNGSNRAEYPFCIPLMAEYLGPNNGSVRFKVDLRPNLPTGTYNLTRSIDIDPPVDGGQVWINYGREIIGSIRVASTEKAETTEQADSINDKTTEAKSPLLPSLNTITGEAVHNIASNSGGIFGLIGLAMICLTLSITIIVTSYLKHRR